MHAQLVKISCKHVKICKKKSFETPIQQKKKKKNI